MSNLTEEEAQSFYSEVCGLVEEKGKGDIEKMVELIDSLEEFRESWIDTYSVTGLLWLGAGENTMTTKTISEAEVIGILAQIETETVEMEAEGNSIKVHTDDLTLEFISLSDDTKVEVKEDKVWTTVSKFLIHKDGEVFEAETDGPFKLDLKGIGLEDVEEDLEE